MKAIVIDIVNNEAALLKEDGSIIKVADQGYEPGQELRLEAVSGAEGVTAENKKKSSNIRHISKGAFAAAIAAALLVTGSICAYAMPYGTVTQGDSSIEYTINVFDRVIDVKANDEAGEAALKEAGNLKHKKIDEALNETLSAGTGIRVETGSENHDRKLTEELSRKIKPLEEEKKPVQEQPDDMQATGSELRKAEPKDAADKPENIESETEHIKSEPEHTGPEPEHTGPEPEPMEDEPDSSGVDTERPSVDSPKAGMDSGDTDSEIKPDPGNGPGPEAEDTQIRPEADVTAPDAKPETGSSENPDKKPDGERRPEGNDMIKSGE